MRHSLVKYAVGLSFWQKPRLDQVPYILPVRPDFIPGRIRQQSSCFTLHMHEANSIEPETLASIEISTKSKPRILNELRQLNVNKFTTYYDLDHLSKEVKYGWNVERSQPGFWSIAGRLLDRKTKAADAVKLLREVFATNHKDQISKAADWLSELKLNM